MDLGLMVSPLPEASDLVVQHWFEMIWPRRGSQTFFVAGDSLGGISVFFRNGPRLTLHQYGRYHLFFFNYLEMLHEMLWTIDISSKTDAGLPTLASVFERARATLIHVHLKSFESVGGFGCAVGPRHHAWQGSRHRGPRRCQGLDPCSGQISKFALRQNCAIEMFEGEFKCRFDDTIYKSI